MEQYLYSVRIMRRACHVTSFIQRECRFVVTLLSTRRWACFCNHAIYSLISDRPPRAVAASFISTVHGRYTTVLVFHRRWPIYSPSSRGTLLSPPEYMCQMFVTTTVPDKTDNMFNICYYCVLFFAVRWLRNGSSTNGFLGLGQVSRRVVRFDIWRMD